MVSVQASLCGEFRLRLGTSRHRKSGLVVVGICLGVYVVFAVAFHRLIEPAVGKNYGVAAYKPPVATVVAHSDAVPVAPTAPEVPSPVASEPYVSAASAAPVPDTTKKTAAVVPKKAPKKPVARTPPRQDQWPRERQNPWDFASRGSYGYRPWF